METASPVQRICFQLQVKADMLAEYRRRHAAVWPEMLREIHASGRRNYSLFLREDGLLIGYFETDSLERSAEYLAASEIAARWEAEMAPFFAIADGQATGDGQATASARATTGGWPNPGTRVDQELSRLPEIFNLHDQLTASATVPAATEGSTAS